MAPTSIGLHLDGHIKGVVMIKRLQANGIEMLGHGVSHYSQYEGFAKIVYWEIIREKKYRKGDNMKDIS